ncbi:IS4 family transposase [Mucilaginibacter sp. L196]|uniref:IS4 family transposase n=1 Tax=Mucilaginibacter sp. L196 TaxID=1641870 RepID=UPI00131C2D7E|nr:IS4 family transposase [Mucilaginibacter sp. L196]
MEVGQLLSLLPESTLSELALLTKVDKYAKKLHGELVFKLLLHCILSYKDNSLRTMESAYESMAFKLLNAQRKSERIRFSSISERLSVIDPAYFEKLYNTCIETYRNLLAPAKPPLIRFDSTIVALSGKLLKVGYHLKGGDADHVRQLKFTIGFSNLPIAVHFFTEQIYTSENAALKQAVLSFKPTEAGVIRVFDRGISSRKTYDELTEKNIPFISRMNVKSKREIHISNQLQKTIQTATLNINSDYSVYLFKDKAVKAVYPVRCIDATRKQDGQAISFITNIKELSAEDITMLYKHRWDIEVFFKFLKQELNFSHLINRSENGIKVMLYCTMIAAILLLAYKELNGLKGYKIVKQKFINDLEISLMKDFVVLCGGDPHKVNTYLKISPE